MHEPSAGLPDHTNPALSRPFAGWTCPLPETGVLAVSGEDAGRFLQGQSTCDILGLSDGRSALGAFCNAKGRVITVFRAFKWGAVYHLLLPRDLKDDMTGRLRRVILRSAVRLEDASAAWRCFGAAGPEPESLASRLGLAVPLETGGVTAFPNGQALGLPGADVARALLMIPAERAETFASVWQDHGFLPETSARWLLEDIRAGLPGVTPATCEEFVPQMLNLDLLGGISFDKGCYIGQEVVARTHYLGKLKRRTFRLGAGAGFHPRAGDPVYEHGKPEQSAGMVVLAAAVEGNGQEMLAVLNLAAVETPDLRWRDAEGPALAMLPLPYPIPY